MNDSDDRLLLEPLDPGHSDPGFWLRFHTQVMDRARVDLARMRLGAEPTIAEVVFAWRRALVPMTLLAAAMAGILLMGGGEVTPPLPPMALEDVLTEGLFLETIPTVLGREAELDEVAFLSSAERF